MSNRYTILNTIITEVEGLLKRSNNYSSEPIRVIPGLPSLDKINQYPTICINLVNDSIIEDTFGDGDSAYRQATFVAVGFTQKIEEMFNLCEDLESFLYEESSFTYKNRTLLDSGGVTFSFGGVTEALNIYMFDFTFYINHNL